MSFASRKEDKFMNLHNEPNWDKDNRMKRNDEKVIICAGMN